MNETRGLRTPNIDALANAGVSFSRYYTNPLCSPSRSALMTGIYNHRIGTQASVIYWDTPWAPAPELEFLPQAFQSSRFARPFATAMYGKWHLGSHKVAAYPSSRGFDEFQGYLQGCGSQVSHISSCCDAPANATADVGYVCPAAAGKDFRGYDWFNGSQPNIAGSNGTASSQLIAAAAEDFINRQTAAGQPFFLYLPFQNIHAPYDCSEASRDLFAHLDISEQQRVIYGYLWELDVAVGRVIAALKATGADRNVIVAFASDNGAPSAPNVTGRNWPLAGFKSQVYEGGTRVPAFVWSPTLLPKAAVYPFYFHVSDWRPTLLAAAGDTSPPDPSLDGINQWSALQQAAGAISSSGASSSSVTDGLRTEVVHNINPLCDGGQFGNPKAALTVGDMKILCWCYSIAGIANGTTTGCQPDPSAPKAWPQLYNVTADPGETQNLAAQLPDVVAALEARLAVIAAASVEPMQWTAPYQGPNYDCADCPLHPAGTGPYVPWQAWIN
jgi:arylsulfatase A-like enzyme